MNNYIEIETESDFVYTLGFIAECLELVKKEDAYWKWVFISLYNALQSALVCTLQGTAQFEVMTKNCAKEWLDWYRNSDDETKYPEAKLDYVNELLKKAKSTKYMNGNAITITQQQNDDFKKLTEIRNKFVHFLPQSWSIETTGFPRIINNIMNIIEQLVAHQKNELRFDDEQRLYIGDKLSVIKQIVKSITNNVASI